MKERLFSAIDLEKEQLAYFLKRLTNKHMILDYKSQTRGQIIEKLKDLFNNDKNDVKNSDIIEHLNVRENDLDKKLVVDVENYLKTCETDSSKIWLTLQTLEDKRIAFIEDLIKSEKEKEKDLKRYR